MKGRQILRIHLYSYTLFKKLNIIHTHNTHICI